MTDTEYMTATQAREELGITKEALKKLLAGNLAWISSPVDKRVKLVKRSDVEAYKQQLANIPRIPRKAK
jgi:hypothetical protein